MMGVALCEHDPPRALVLAGTLQGVDSSDSSFCLGLRWPYRVCLQFLRRSPQSAVRWRRAALEAVGARGLTEVASRSEAAAVILAWERLG